MGEVGNSLILERGKFLGESASVFLFGLWSCGVLLNLGCFLYASANRLPRNLWDVIFLPLKILLLATRATL